MIRLVVADDGGSSQWVVASCVGSIGDPWDSSQAEEKFSRRYIPVMVRLEAAARGARMAGRAALTAIWEAMREATMREAIAKVVKRGVGGEVG